MWAGVPRRCPVLDGIRGPAFPPSVTGSQRHRLRGNQGGRVTAHTLFFLESDPRVFPRQWGQTEGAGEGTPSPHSSLSREQGPERSLPGREVTPRPPALEGRTWDEKEPSEDSDAGQGREGRCGRRAPRCASQEDDVS